MDRILPIWEKDGHHLYALRWMTSQRKISIFSLIIFLRQYLQDSFISPTNPRKVFCGAVLPRQQSLGDIANQSGGDSS